MCDDVQCWINPEQKPIPNVITDFKLRSIKIVILDMEISYSYKDFIEAVPKTALISLLVSEGTYILADITNHSHFGRQFFPEKKLFPRDVIDP